MKKKLKLVIDTNVWVSYLIGKKTKYLEKLILDDSIEIYASSKLLNELYTVLNRPKFTSLIPKAIINEFLVFSENIFKVIEVTSKVSICRDPEDNFILELCKDCNANYLITGDKDLQVIEKFSETQIVSLRTFIQEYNI